MSALARTTIDILRDLVAFDTTSRNSNLELIHYIRRHLEKHGVVHSLIPNPEGTKANLFASIGAGNGGYVLSGHTDVVPVDGQVWDTPPLTLTGKNSRFYGRGTADMKSFVAVCLAMLPEFLKQPLKKPLHFAFSHDEEVGCLGVPHLLSYLKQSGIKPELAIIGEPTGMQPIATHKGIAAFETIVTGLEAHSSTPHKGVNAVMIASELVAFLRGLAREYARDYAQDDRFDPPYTTIHVGVIQGGTARNIIPRECHFLWEVRTLPGEKLERISERFETKCAELRKEITAISADTAIITRSLNRVDALRADENSDHQHLLMSLAGSNRLGAVSFFSEASLFEQQGIPCFVCGPGSIDQAHKPNEFIEISQIESCIVFMRRLVESLR